MTSSPRRGLGELAAAQPRADEVQLGLCHRAVEAEQEPVVELARVIEPVLIADERAGHRADLQQPVPVGVVAGQPGDLQAQHDPGASMPTSATRRWKPSREAAEAPDWP